MTMRTIDPAGMFLKELPQPVLAAVSGGMDSMCLLHLLRAEGVSVTAAHYNHNLRATAARDEAFVRETCAAGGIPLICGGGDVRAFAAQTGKTLEEAGRELRYAFLEESRRACGCAVILTAHHADDNAETLLLNLLRGTGLQGLTGIPPQRDGICRPLLSLTREELAQYAEENAVPFVEDETNLLDDAARNVLRHKVLPVLRELNPKAVENMNRTAALLAQDQRALEAAAGALVNRCTVTAERAQLPLAVCGGQPEALLSRAALELMAAVGGHRKDLTARHVESLLALRNAERGKCLSLPYGMTARRETETIVIEVCAPAPAAVSLAVGEPVAFGRWQVCLSETFAAGSLPVKQGDYAVTPWRPTDRMTLSGTRGKRSLKRLLAERGIDPAERDAMPVLRAGETPAAMPVLGVDLDFTPQNDEAALYVTFTKL